MGVWVTSGVECGADFTLLELPRTESILAVRKPHCASLTKHSANKESRLTGAIYGIKHDDETFGLLVLDQCSLRLTSHPVLVHKKWLLLGLMRSKHLNKFDSVYRHSTAL